ncbi:IS66 family insertion sequence element accessory protein TnpB [Neolewinella sp.]|uniref:IS66 family insertion sequence element accessory protein TnpB n=1 Tax=Neolewinella sp. TaxID=2993543 RepID=UPI003B5191B8
MLSFSSRQRYFLYRGVTDMRKGFNGFRSGLVREHIDHELLSGDVSIFLNRRRDRIKLLVWDRTGFVVWYKVLERGTFELPAAAESDRLEMSWTDIQLLLEGIEIKSVKRRKRYSKAA